jgi:hypothetical protein
MAFTRQGIFSFILCCRDLEIRNTGFDIIE